MLLTGLVLIVIVAFYLLFGALIRFSDKIIRLGDEKAEKDEPKVIEQGWL